MTADSSGPLDHACASGTTLWVNDDHGHRKICPECATPEHHARIEAANRTALDRGILTRAHRTARDRGPWWEVAWPYGPNIDVDVREALVAWAEPLGLRRSTQSRQCLHWLRGKRCPRRWEVGDDCCRDTVPDGDHETTWTLADGKTPALILNQPYGHARRARAEIEALAEADDLRVEFDEAGGWYGNRTIFVAVWRADSYAIATRAV